MTTKKQKLASARRGGIKKLFLCGCLLPMVMLSALVVGGLGYGWHYLSGVVETYTEENPMEIASVEFTEDESGEITSRVKAFSEKLAAGENASQLVLSSRDVNILLNSDPTLKNNVHVKLRDGNVYGEVSLPADMIPGGSGRYFNATVELDVAMKDGALDLQLVDAQVKGEDLPAEIREQIAGVNLAEEAYKNPRSAGLMAQLESIEVRGDRLILTPKPGDKSDFENTLTNVGYQPNQAGSKTDTRQSLEKLFQNSSNTPMSTASTPRPAASRPSTATGQQEEPQFIYSNQGKIRINQFVK